jgi:hypothetical protein
LFQTAKNLALVHLRKEKVRSLHIDHNADESAILEIALSAPSSEKVVFMGQQMALLLKVLAHGANLGISLQAFFCFMGLVVTMLSVTEVYLWLKKRRAVRAKQKLFT